MSVKYLIISTEELAHRLRSLPVGETLDFAAFWNEVAALEGQPLRNGDCAEWYGIRKIPGMDSSGAPVYYCDYYGGGAAWCFEDADPAEVAENLDTYILDYCHGTPREGYVCLEVEE